MHGAIGQKKLSAAGMAAPKMKSIARVLVLARSKRIRTVGAGWRAEGRPIIGDTEKAISRAIPFLADSGIPPAETVVWAGGTLANHQSIARTVGDRIERDARIQVEKTVVRCRGSAAYAQVVSEGYVPTFGSDNAVESRLGRAQKDMQGSGQAGVRRRAAEIRVLREILFREQPYRLLFQIGQKASAPRQVGIGIGIKASARRERSIDIMILMKSQTDLPQIIGAAGATGGFAGTLDGGKGQTDQHSENSQNYQKLDQSEGAASGF